MRCTLCGRKMQPSPIRDRVYYRCGTRNRKPPFTRARPPADHQPARRHPVRATGHVDRPRLRPGAGLQTADTEEGAPPRSAGHHDHV
ncbi:zinc ribbon domain-containing protein [Streptomyces sp. NPDC005706]|uniref:zinc ribbon domain-containing protein n=1 Tax=Streptomyces sp. NPDC005706 TaxID=3157169 RepID=UPI0033D0258A